MPLSLMYITNSPNVAQIAEQNGVERIWIDLETLGKQERQGGMDTVKSRHTVDDINKIKQILSKSQLLVRVNPINDGSAKEIEAVIEAGADMIMLPMWKSLDDVRCFLDLVGGRAATTLLLETREAVECLDQVLEYGGFDEIHIGLNDLHLSYKRKFMFELLADGTVENLCKKIKAYRIPYGFGGIARLGMGLLPAERIIMEHYRLGSTRAILSRSFCNYEKCESLDEVENIFKIEVKKLRDFEESIKYVSSDEFINNQERVKEAVNEIILR